MSDSLSQTGKTQQRRVEQFRDRWSSFGASTGVEALAEKLSAQELRRFEIFADYDDAFLERISPDVSVAQWRADATLFEEGSYIDLAFYVEEGEVEVGVEAIAGEDGTFHEPIFDLSRTIVGSAAPLPRLDTALSRTQLLPAQESNVTFLASMDFNLEHGAVANLGPGELFGEIGALSGWPQSVTARTTTACKLVQIRLNALRLMKRRSKALKERLDDIYRQRSLVAQLKTTPLLRGCDDMFIGALKETVELVSLEPDEVLVEEGAVADSLYLVRSGFIKLLQRFGEGEVVATYLSKGMTLGEAELLMPEIGGWQATARSVEYSELVRIPRQAFERLLEHYPDVEQQLWQSSIDRIQEMGASRRSMSQSEFTQVALDRGLVQGNSILVIDLDTCTRCDDCVRACEATHDGRARFVREGFKYDNLLVPRSCFHCRDPVCLVGCPTGAIHRSGLRDVVEVTDSICIGCSSCANSCPYGAIVMHDTGDTWPDDMLPASLRGKPRKVASKCDLCESAGHEPACTSNCPQGCAVRVSSLDEFQDLLREDR